MTIKNKSKYQKATYYLEELSVLTHLPYSLSYPQTLKSFNPFSSLFVIQFWGI